MVRRSLAGMLVMTSAMLLFATAACSASPNSAHSAANSSKSSSFAQPAATSGAVSNAPAVAAASVAATSVAARAAQPAAAAATASTAAGALAGPASSLGAGASLDRKIIRNADLAIEVKDTGAAIDSVASIATGLGGYVASSKLTRTDDVLRGTITLRVPAEQFDTAMSEIKGLGTKVTRENITGQDVTEEYTDLDARIANLESTAEQLRLLEATVRDTSNRVDDILTVYNQLTTITGQIEQAKGRRNALSQLGTLATLSVEVSPPPVVVEPPKPPPPPPAPPKHVWTARATLDDALAALGGLGQALAQAGIWIGVLGIPLLAAAGLLLYAGRLAARRWRTAP
ncbi:MAG: DUF4349 domain-containing protein [Dehalococcoidia bacterium]